jgi:hypothetical protein
MDGQRKDVEQKNEEISALKQFKPNQGGLKLTSHLKKTLCKVNLNFIKVKYKYM